MRAGFVLVGPRYFVVIAFMVVFLLVENFLDDALVVFVSFLELFRCAVCLCATVFGCEASEVCAFVQPTVDLFSAIGAAAIMENAVYDFISVSC